MPQYTIKGPLADGTKVYASTQTATRALDRLDNKYGSYAHQIKVVTEKLRSSNRKRK